MANKRACFISASIEKQANLLNKKDKTYNLDNFGKAKEGKQNLMYITGFSGGGKGTLAKQLADKHKANIIELDGFKYNFDSSSKHPLVKKYFEKNPHLKGNINVTNYNAEASKFVDFAKDYVKQHPNEKFIFEGIQLLGRNDMDVPRVVKGTGAIESAMRAKKRDSVGPNFHYKKPLALNMALNEKINNERRNINKSIKLHDLDRAEINSAIKGLKRTALKHPLLMTAGATAGAIGVSKFVSNKIRENSQNKNKEKMYEEKIKKTAMEYLLNE